MELEIEHRFPPTPDSVAAARRSLGRLAGHVPEPLLSDLRLLVSELVTNSVRHARLGSKDVIELRVALSGDSVRLEVADPGPGFEATLRPPGPDGSSGWGLHVVDAIADRWGVDHRDSTRVWVEINRPSEPRKRPPGNRPEALSLLSCCAFLTT
jgi:anti-sigma regulatory factor (Ser/Thr protein kinase)